MGLKYYFSKGKGRENKLLLGKINGSLVLRQCLFRGGLDLQSPRIRVNFPWLLLERGFTTSSFEIWGRLCF